MRIFTCSEDTITRRCGVIQFGLPIRAKRCKGMRAIIDVGRPMRAKIGKRPNLASLDHLCVNLRLTDKHTYPHNIHTYQQFVHMSSLSVRRRLQGGEDPQDALFLEVVFRKRALELVAPLRKETCNLRHSMHLRHPVHMSSLCPLCDMIRALSCHIHVSTSPYR